MRKSLFTFFAACLVSVLGAGALSANAIDQAKAQEAAALEESLFINCEASAASEAKAAQELLNEVGQDGDAKCCFWYYSYPTYYYYPSYYYYSWYCPVYYVNFRLVTYTVPAVVTPAVTVVSPATTVATTTTTTVAQGATILKAGNQTARGAVIDKTVPTNSPLYKMGLRAGDIITSVDGNAINSIADVRRVTANSKITFIHGNQIKVAEKQILQRGASASAKSVEGIGENQVQTSNIQKTQEKSMTLYEYYDSLNDNATVTR